MSRDNAASDKPGDDKTSDGADKTSNRSAGEPDGKPGDEPGEKPTGGKPSSRDLYNKVLRELRAEIQDLRELIGRIKAGTTTVANNATYLQKTHADVEALCTELSEVNRNRRSDSVRHILNVWEQMRANPIFHTPDEIGEVQDVLHNLTTIEEQSDRIVLLVGMQTIPHRVNRWLAQARPGYYLPFHMLFADELPSPGDRQRVLEAIAAAPDAVENGIVDAAGGVIYRYETTRANRIKSLLQIIGALLLASAVVVASCYLGRWFDVSEWPLEARFMPDLLFSWFALLLGVGTHGAVSRVRRRQSSSLPPVVAAGDWLLQISARKGEILLNIVVALFVLYGLVLGLGPENSSAMEAFLAGYSFDSVSEVFSSAAEKKGATQVTRLEEQLGVSK